MNQNNMFTKPIVYTRQNNLFQKNKYGYLLWITEVVYPLQILLN